MLLQRALATFVVVHVPLKSTIARHQLVDVWFANPTGVIAEEQLIRLKDYV